MTNVSEARTSEQQTFVLVLFLSHLSLQIRGEVLRALPTLLFSHIYHKGLQFVQYYISTMNLCEKNRLFFGLLLQLWSRDQTIHSTDMIYK